MPELAAARIDCVGDEVQQRAGRGLPPVREGRLRRRMTNGSEALHAA
jgi:hypothetical protein